MIERVLYNARIITLDDARPRATALAIRDGKIVAVGSDDEMLALAGVSTIRQDMERAVIIPGLTDSHMHWQMTSDALGQVRLYDVPDRETAVALVAERAASNPPGAWIRGYGWSQDSWTDRRFPTAADLDAATPDRPVYLVARSAHAAWVNSAALRLAGIDASTPDPEGGQIQRDRAGMPTGILFEWTAMDLVKRHIPPPTVDQIADQMHAAQDKALAVGLTGFHDFDDQECFAALQVLRERGDLALRVLKHVNKKYLDAALHLGLRRGFGDDWIRLGSLKLFADGAMGPRTASMIEPYDGEPDNYGVIVVDKEEMVELVGRASAAGLASTVHAIGDRAVHDVLDVFQTVRAQEDERGEARSTRRHRIEHVQLIHPDDMDRLAELDIIASMQPIHATSDYRMADRYWGKRAAYAYNPRLQIDRGVVVAFGSDSPVEDFDPFKGIHAAVTRRRADGSPGADGWYPEARLTVDEALRGYTTGAAYAAGIDDRLGRIAPGFLADLVAIDSDPYAIPPDALLETQVLGTMVDGVWRCGVFG